MTIRVCNFTKFFVFWLFVVMFFATGVKAETDTQVTFLITKIPSYTPSQDTIYMSTSLNQWKLADKNFIFRPFPDGTYRLTLNLKKGEEMIFKVNRGDWSKTEGTEGGAFMENRTFVATDSVYDYRFEVRTWEDLHKAFFPSVKLKVVSVPKNTPEDAKIYVSGNFNNWSVKDPNYELRRLSDGTYEVDAGQGFSRIEYKFNRGTWSSSEGRFDGGPLSNRRYINNQKDGVVIASIESWEDLSSGPMWRKMIFTLLLIEIIKVLLVVVAFTRSPYPFIVLSIILVGFFLRILFSGGLGYEIFPKGYLLPSMLYGFLGPLLYYWLESEYSNGRNRWFFILPIIPFLTFTPYLFVSSDEFRYFLVNPILNVYFVGIYLYGLILNIYYGHKAINLIQKMKKEIAEWKYLLFRGWAALGWVTLSIFVFSGLLMLFDVDENLIKDWFENFVWIGLGALVIMLETKALLYFISYAIKGKIKTYEPTIGEQGEESEDSWTLLRPRLVYLMEEKEVFTNAKLSLSDLAQNLGTNTNYVSRLLNECLKTSFADYVNAYRIKYFIKMLKEDKNQSKTFLFHAYNSGFNSKSAFNRAFKRYTGKTPSEYFENLDVPDLDN